MKAQFAVIQYFSLWTCNTRSDYAYWRAKKGDICRYISENGYGPGGNYRMPTSYEMGSKEGDYNYDDADGWTRESVALWGQGHSATEADGTQVMPNYISNSNGNVTFPATGYRGTSGDFAFLNYNVVYWSASAGANNILAFCFCGWNDAYTGSIIRSAVPCYRNEGLAVRCVQN